MGLRARVEPWRLRGVVGRRDMMLISKQVNLENMLMSTELTPPELQGPERERTRLDDESADRLRAAIGRLARRLRPTLAATGMTPTQISVLLTVARRGPLGISELAEIEAINPTMLSRVVVQLCELGLIRRESRPDDRRAATVTATPAGRRMRERVHRERARALAEYVAELQDSEQMELVAALPALERLVELIDERRP
jgi:DNA-binding MarR family transcriptional regulator